MSNIIQPKTYITSEDISLVQQQRQRRYLKIQLVDRNWNSLCIIHGRLISATCNIESSEGIRRNANITIETDQRIIHLPTQDIDIDLQKDLFSNYYIRLWAGIEDNNTLIVKWYNQGLFIINQYQYNFDPTTRTLSMGLTDLMSDLTGDRAGVLHAYTSLVKNEQRIDDVMVNILGLTGFSAHNITPIVPLQSVYDNNVYAPSAEDYMIPYDKNFDVGVSAYDILAWLVSLYPYYEIGFDVEGTFFCHKKLLEQDDSYPIIDGITLRGLVISEDTTLDFFSVKNDIEVWGKDGLYFAEALDTNPESPFQVANNARFRCVISGSEDGIDTNNICDRYRDTELASTLLKEQAEIESTIASLEALDNPTTEQISELNQAKSDLLANKRRQENNVSIKGDDLAQEWADQKLYEKSRIYDSVSITTINMPFLTDVGFKLAYRSKIDEIMRPYKVESISHDYIAGTSTFNMVRFYTGQCSKPQSSLNKPVIEDYNIGGMTLTVLTSEVAHAERYTLYMNGQFLVSSTGTTLPYTFDRKLSGNYSIYVVAEADYYIGSASDPVQITLDLTERVVANDGSSIIDDAGNRIIINTL